MLRLLRRPALAQDWTLRKEGRKTVGQICRPIPEGYRRHRHAEFATFLQYSLASLAEKDFLDDAQERGLLTTEDLKEPRQLCYRLDRALTGFIRYLRTHKEPPWWT